MSAITNLKVNIAFLNLFIQIFIKNSKKNANILKRSAVESISYHYGFSQIGLISNHRDKVSIEET